MFIQEVLVVWYYTVAVNEKVTFHFCRTQTTFMLHFHWACLAFGFGFAMRFCCESVGIVSFDVASLLLFCAH